MNKICFDCKEEGYEDDMIQLSGGYEWYCKTCINKRIGRLQSQQSRIEALEKRLDAIESRGKIRQCECGRLLGEGQNVCGLCKCYEVKEVTP